VIVVGDSQLDHVRVLIVEDNPADRDLVKEILEMGRGTFLLQEATRLDDAKAMLSEEGFDLALVDLGLPDSQGLATVVQLAADFPELPFVVFTGQPDLGTAAIQAGAQDYLIKGWMEPEALERVLDHALERHRSQRAAELR
jgi:DNA-binding NtrC family response regulator